MIKLYNLAVLLGEGCWFAVTIHVGTEVSLHNETVACCEIIYDVFIYDVEPQNKQINILCTLKFTFLSLYSIFTFPGQRSEPVLCSYMLCDCGGASQNPPDHVFHQVVRRSWTVV